MQGNAKRHSKELLPEKNKDLGSVLLQLLCLTHSSVVEKLSSGTETTIERQNARIVSENENNETAGYKGLFDDGLPAEVRAQFADPERYERCDNLDWIAFAARTPTRYRALVY